MEGRREGAADRAGRLVAVAVELERPVAGEGPRTAALRTALETAYPGLELRSTDPLIGLVAGDVDPLAAVLRATLDPALPVARWAVAVRPGSVEPAGVAVAAREALWAARRSRDGLAIGCGIAASDELLGALAPLLADLLGDLTARQRHVARLLLVDGLRQSEVAERLGVARATISVMTARGHLRSIARLVEAIRLVAVP